MALTPQSCRPQATFTLLEKLRIGSVPANQHLKTGSSGNCPPIETVVYIGEGVGAPPPATTNRQNQLSVSFRGLATHRKTD